MRVPTRTPGCEYSLGARFTTWETERGAPEVLARLPTMSRRTRILLGVTVALLAWFAITVRWATQPLSDAVPIGKDKFGKVVVANVECNTLFDASPMNAGDIPVIVAPDAVPATSEVPIIVRPVDAFGEWALPRTPCTQVHKEARVLLGINVVVFVLSLAAIGVVASRTRRPPIPQMTAAAA